ncbi:MAG: ISKra4 family transposase, partial [Dehalococcoidia bacterium]
DRGDLPALLAATRALALRDTTARHVEKALAYFETNAQRMRYAAFREAGHFVGSGAVEAGCKAVIGQRLKLSGMRWSVRGATGIIALRCHEASGRWDDVWSRIHNQTSAA